MAATVTSPWGNKPRSWALDSEEHEQELNDSAAVNNAVAAPLNDFPTLSAVATTKTKKKKPQPMNLAEFSTYDPAKVRESKLDNIVLPKGPRERTAEELESNKGFRSWGVGGNNRETRGSDEPRRQGSFNKEFTPSRADETDNWGAVKKTSVGGGFDRGERRERSGYFDNSQSKADESDNWGANKSFVPSDGGRKYERQRVGFEPSGGSDSDNWGKKKEEEGRKFGAFDSLRERRGGGFEREESWGKKREEVGSVRPKLNLQPRKVQVGEEVQNGSVSKPKGLNPFGNARPREEVLKEQGKEVQVGEEVQVVEEVQNVSVSKPKGPNPFGNARPREEVLKEQGKDWKEVDEKLESFKLREKESGLSDGAGFGKRSFGSGNGQSGGNDDRSGRSWRKPVDVDARPQSAENAENGENGHTEATETSHSENIA